MRKTWIILAASALAAASLAAQTRDQAKSFVKQAVDMDVAAAKGKLLYRRATQPALDGPTKGTLFVYDLEGKVLAHGVRRELVGVARWTAKDPDGKPWIQDWTKLVKEKGNGWIEYKELNPAQNNKVMKKASFVELFNGMVIGAGIYE